MNFLRRAIAAQPLLSAHSSPKRLVVLYPISFYHHSSLYSTSRTATTYATTKYKYTPQKSKTLEPQQPVSPSLASNSDVVEKKPVDWARPSEIPYQAKVANSVNLIGHVHIPVQFKATEDGNYWAGTIIAQQQSRSTSPPVWIPVVFEGDLAHIAKCHLKENDYIYVAGELCVDQPPLTLSEGQTTVQVIAHNLNFIEVCSKSTKSSIRQAADVSLIQSEKLKATNSSEPTSLDQKETFENLHHKKTSHFDKTRKKGSFSKGSWRDLLKDPKQWCDYRESKRNGLVSAKHPDFKHKDSGDGLWLSSAPGGVLAGLGGLSFDVNQVKDETVSVLQRESSRVPTATQRRKPPHTTTSGDGAHGDGGGGDFCDFSFLHRKSSQSPSHKDGDHWNDLVANPDKWLDNRSKKVSERSPDFKHKESGKALWLSSSPPWVSSSFPPLEAKLTSMPPLKEKQNDASGQDGDSWKDLVENPKRWWDNRSNKLNPKAPDFKHKDTAKVLWLSHAPAWALPGLPLLKLQETDGRSSYQKKKTETDAGAFKGDPWKDLVENPKNWWDNRSKKFNEKSPDFKHKEIGKALWLSDAPQWALSSLPPLKAKKVGSKTWGAEAI